MPCELNSCEKKVQQHPQGSTSAVHVRQQSLLSDPECGRISWCGNSA